MTNEVALFLYNTYRRQTQDLANWAFLFRESADAYHAKGFPYEDCFCMLDGKLFRTARPISQPTENSAFSGHKKQHGNNYQTFAIAHGLTIGFFGPGEGSNHTDAWHYHNERLHDQMLAAVGAAVALFGPANWCGFSDGAYPISAVMQKGFAGVRTRDQDRFNGRCNRTGRVSVEWNFHVICSNFPFIDTYRKQQILSNATGVWTHNAMMLSNWWVCCNGGLLPSFFDVEPPTLETYFRV
jgi:hypothetical protein